MHVFHCDHHELPLPANHRFPAAKNRLLHELLLREGILSAAEIAPARLGTREELALAHDPDFIDQVFSNSVDPAAWKKVGFPWSEELVLRSRATVGGLIEAARWALTEGVAGVLAGGNHHAHRDAGEGFCVFNDIAVATRVLQREGAAAKIAIVDLDVHQGNGNAGIFAGDASVFTFSMHGKNNFPFQKIPSSLDLELADGTGDAEYLQRLREGLSTVRAFRPDFLFYQMGVDALKEDHLGRLALTLEGLRERDRLVLSFCHAQGVPVAMALGGGYARPIEATVRAYANTYAEAKKIYG